LVYYAKAFATNYYWGGAKFTFTASDGSTQTSDWVGPGGVFVFTKTNSSPFTYNITSDWYTGEGQFVGQSVGGTYSAATNYVAGGTSSGSVGIVAPNNPAGAGTGAGNTNPVTGDQISQVFSNTYNATYNMAQAVASGLGQLKEGLATNQLPDPRLNYLTNQMQLTNLFGMSSNMGGAV